MDWFAPVDLYCERTSPALWNEPFNAISNLAFLLAAAWAAQTWNQLGRRDSMALLLTVLAVAVGIGSFLFHTFANRWSELADILPILTFVSAYAVAAVLRFAGARLAPGIASALAALALAGPAAWVMWLRGSPQAPTGPDAFNGSGQYLPAAAGLVVLALVLTVRQRASAPWIAAAALAFCAALAFRTADLALCAAWPMGTHFLWHLLDGLTVALLLQAMVRAGHRSP
jgi:Ceramidase